MSNEITRERELVLAPNQFAYLQDETKGSVNVYVGPHKASLSPTDRPMRFVNGKFERCDLSAAIQEFPLVTEGSYLVLQNPASSKEQPHPPLGTPSGACRLSVGRKINMSGPLSFPLWPGQIATVIEGHRLRSNQYVLARVYNPEEAKLNQGTAVKTSTNMDAPDAKPQETAALADLTIGKLLIIKGTDVSFYIPPTGIEVVPDAAGKFIRDAETLERLEYCILLDESGDKSVVKGPSVVFPSPTQTFVEERGLRKFRATELNPDMGIHIKVTADYEEGDVKYTTGQELFITGREQQIYYPRPEHAIIKYGDRQITYGVTIPEGDGRYVLNKETGNVDLIRGPRIFTPDPRKEVLVRRVLELREVTLYYPDNQYALDYNARLLEVLRDTTGAAVGVAGALEESAVRSRMPVTRNLVSATVALNSMATGEFQRGSSYTPPRTITLDTKYEGAVAISVWEGYAIKINRKSGESRVVVGPKTELLGYDESLQVLQLSTGKPKNQDRLERTVYLRVGHNQVTDVVDVITKDLVTATLKISYRVNFEGEPSKWFSVENYVKFLCDHGRSVLRNVAKQHGIEAFHANHVSIVRDTILGAKPEGGGKRRGLVFEENGMRAYDVEILNLTIGDTNVSTMLYQAQHETVKTALGLGAAERQLVAQQRLAAIDVTVKELETDKLTRDYTLLLAKITAESETAEARWEIAEAELNRAAARSAAARTQITLDSAQTLSVQRSELELRLQSLAAEAESLVKRAAAISPDLVAALQVFGSQVVATEAAKAMAPLAILGGNSVADVLKNVLGNTQMGKALASGLEGRSLPTDTRPNGGAPRV